MDFVNYKPSNPWPVLNNKNSIQLIDANLDNNEGESWKDCDNIKGSPGFINDGLATSLNTEIFEDEILKIFPNPTKDFVSIKLENNLPSELILMDVSGKILLQKIFTNSSNINLSNFNNGIFLVSVSNNFQIITKRVNLVK